MRTWIEISEQSFNHNISQLKNILGSTQLAIVLKSNAYGHGLKEVGYLANKNNQIDWLCTAGLNEALELRENKIQKKIIVLYYIDNEYKKAIENEIRLPVYDYEVAKEINNEAYNLKKKAKIHVKIDTGMSHLGILYNKALSFIESVSKLEFIEIEAIFTHLCDTPNPDPQFSFLQLERFEKLLKDLKNLKINLPFAHAYSSSALRIKNNNNYDILRAGATAFGIWKSEKHRSMVLDNYTNLNLQPVLTWKTKIINIKEIPAGSSIGYDRTYQASKDMKIAIIPVGYSDGYSRNLSNKGIVIINNQEAPVVGIISMNITAIDVTHIPNVSIGNEVILIGSHSNVKADICAQKAGIITNDLISRINISIPRVIS